MTGLIAEAIEGIYHKQPKTKDNLYIVENSGQYVVFPTL